MGCCNETEKKKRNNNKVQGKNTNIISAETTIKKIEPPQEEIKKEEKDVVNIIETNQQIDTNPQIEKLKQGKPSKDQEQEKDNDNNKPSTHHLEIYKDNIKINSCDYEDTLPLSNLLNFNDDKDYSVYYLDSNLTNYLNIPIGNYLSSIPAEQEIIIKCISAGIVPPQNLKTAYSNYCSIIGSISLDEPESLTIITYDNNKEEENNKISKYVFPYNEELQKGGLLSAYCNCNNSIYLSGGELSNGQQTSEYLNCFYQIDLSKLSANSQEIPKVNLPNLCEARSWHSMIFVPPCYIFIVGGTNTKSVEIFNISNNNIFIDSELNEFRGEPTLCLFNDNYLYAFCGFLVCQNYCTFIERCNLCKRQRKWEIINFNINDDIEYSPSFCGACYYNDGILLIGANEYKGEKNKSYLFKKDDDNNFSVSEFNITFENNAIFKEKFFIPNSENSSICIPMIIKNTQIFVFNEERGCIETSNYNSEEFLTQNRCDTYGEMNINDLNVDTDLNLINSHNLNE